MSGNFERVFGTVKPVIAMVHLGALPGSPLLRRRGGHRRASSRARARISHALQAAGFDAVMFGNENDRPYEFKVDTASTATMAYVIGQLRAEIAVPVRRQRAVGPDEPRSRSRPRPAPPSCARSSPAPTPPTWGPGRRTRARPCAIATGSAGATSRCSTTSRPSSPIRSTSAAWPTGPAAPCSPRIPDAILVSGAITGEAAAMADLEAVKAVLPRDAGARQHRRQARDGRGRAADRRRLHRRLVAEGRRRHLERGRSGPRRRVHAARPRRARAEHDERRTALDAKRAARLLCELMLIPGCRATRGGCAAASPRRADGLGLQTSDRPARQPDRHHRGRPRTRRASCCSPIWTSSASIVRKIEANGLVRVERLGGVPERALPAQEVLFCVGEGARRAAASSPTRATTRPRRTRSTACCPIPSSIIDAGFAQRRRGAGGRHRYRHAGRLRAARSIELAGDRIAGTAVDDRAGCAVIVEVARALIGARARGRPCISSSRCRRSSTCAAR